MEHINDKNKVNDKYSNDSNDSDEYSDEEVDCVRDYDYDYVQFKNNVLNLIYGRLPSYAYFYEGNFQADLEDGYWTDFSDEEATKILIYFSNTYLDTNINEDTIKQEEWDVQDMLLELLLDYF